MIPFSTVSRTKNNPNCNVRRGNSNAFQPCGDGEVEIAYPLNRTREAGRARTLILISFLLFVLAAVSTLVQQWINLYLVLPLVLFGVFALTLSAIIREHSKVAPRIGNLAVKQDGLAMEELVEEEMDDGKASP